MEDEKIPEKANEILEAKQKEVSKTMEEVKKMLEELLQNSQEEANKILKAEHKKVSKMLEELHQNSQEKAKTATEEISHVAKNQNQIDLFAFEHQKEIEKIKASVEEIKKEEKTAENREELLKKIEKLETRYKVFGRYINKEDWENLYRTKFDILMSDINQRTESPLLELDETAYETEIPIYARILEEKISAIITGRNPELKRAFGERVPEAVEIIKGILQGNENNLSIIIGHNIYQVTQEKKKTQNANGTTKYNFFQILQDKDALRLILAFDKNGGLEKLTVNKDEVKGLNEEDFEWTDTIPLKTLYFRLKMDPEYSIYKGKENHIKFLRRFI